MSTPDKRSIDLFEDDEIVFKKKNCQKTKKRELTTVIVRNLPNNYNFYKVKRYFEECGKIDHIDVRISKDNITKVARIEFESYDSVLCALTKTFKKINNNEIIVEELKNCTIWVTNFPPRYTIKDLSVIFSEFGCVLSVRLPSLKFNSSRRFAYIDMDKEEYVNKAIKKLNGTEYEGYKLVVKRSDPLEKIPRSDIAVLERREILIRKLDGNEIKLDTLRNLVDKFGEIENIHIPKNKHDEKINDNYSFIVFKDNKSAKNALSLNKCVFEGSQIHVKIIDRKSYLERQEVKKIMNYSKTNDKVVCIFPLNDKISKDHIIKFILDNTNINEHSIEKVMLVNDYEGAIILLKDANSAANLIISLNHRVFNKTILNCGTTNELKSYKISGTTTTSKQRKCIPEPYASYSSSQVPIQKDGMTNEDFRHMLFGNK